MTRTRRSRGAPPQTDSAPGTGAGVPADLQRAVSRLGRPGHAVIGTDPEGRILVWSGEAEALFGWRADEVIGRSILDVTPSELSRSEAAAIMESLRAGHPWTGQFVVRNRAGERFTVQVEDHPVQDEGGRLRGIVGVSRRVAYMDG